MAEAEVKCLIVIFSVFAVNGGENPVEVGIFRIPELEVLYLAADCKYVLTGLCGKGLCCDVLRLAAFSLIIYKRAESYGSIRLTFVDNGYLKVNITCLPVGNCINIAYICLGS